ncbi:Uncharacterised protein [Legionella beliardensis]|uniref:Uncharacterized protein n=1 Tax=Legionella beliardensis TaxID=91822 RepID=A0A378JSL4_9GAMM|nr:Uncharacterised protein [Legionella beliardensis]
MPITQYERYQNNLDQTKVLREITSSEVVIARGVSAPYENAPTPTVRKFYF